MIHFGKYDILSLLIIFLLKNGTIDIFMVLLILAFVTIKELILIMKEV